MTTLKKIERFFLVLITAFCCFYDIANAETLFSLSDDQIYISLDSGQSWKGVYIESSVPLRFNDLCFDSASKTVYAATSAGIAKSVDGGRIWNKLSFFNENVNYIVPSLDGSHHIYAVTWESLYVSSDGGKSWKALGLPSKQIFFLAPFAKSKVIYAAGGGSLYVSSNSGYSWKILGKDIIGDGVIFDMAVNPANRLQLYLASSNGLLYTGDGGKSWKIKNIGSKDWIQTVKIIWCRENPNCLYALDSDVKEGGKCYVRKSLDKGNKWYTIASKDEIFLIAADPLKASTVYFTGISLLAVSGVESSLASVSKSFDGGRTWKVLESVMPGYSKAKLLLVAPW